MKKSSVEIRKKFSEIIKSNDRDVPDSTADIYLELIDALDDISQNSRTEAGNILRNISPKELKALGINVPLTRCPRCKATIPKDNIINCAICEKNLACHVCAQDARGKFECEAYSCRDIHENVDDMTCVDCLDPQEKLNINLVKRPKETIEKAIKNNEKTCITCRYWDLETYIITWAVNCYCIHPSKVKEKRCPALHDSCFDWAVRDTSDMTDLPLQNNEETLQEPPDHSSEEGEIMSILDPREKWTQARKTNSIGLDIGIDCFSMDSFVIFLSEATGCGPCSSSCEVPLFFESVEDGLAYLRFYLLPRTLNMLVNHDDEGALEAEEYLDELKTSDKNKILELIQIIDKALDSKKVSDTVLTEIQDRYNSFFDPSRFIAQELAIGDVPTVIKTLIIRDGDDVEDTDKELLELIGSNDFDGFNDEHEDMVREFFESRIY